MSLDRTTGRVKTATPAASGRRRCPVRRSGGDRRGHEVFSLASHSLWIGGTPAMPFPTYPLAQQQEHSSSQTQRPGSQNGTFNCRQRKK